MLARRPVIRVRALLRAAAAGARGRGGLASERGYPSREERVDAIRACLRPLERFAGSTLLEGGADVKLNVSALLALDQVSDEGVVLGGGPPVCISVFAGWLPLMAAAAKLLRPYLKHR